MPQRTQTAAAVDARRALNAKEELVPGSQKRGRIAGKVTAY
jgi:hypothetical protein